MIICVWGYEVLVLVEGLGWHGVWGLVNLRRCFASSPSKITIIGFHMLELTVYNQLDM